MTPADGDKAAPTSAASSPVYSTSPAIAVAYSASDAGAGLGRVELWARTPDGGGFTRVRTHTVTGAAVTGSFSYSAGDDGTYAFYTVAVDAAGNVEPAPATADSTTMLDRSEPVSNAASPTYTNSATFAVSYEAFDVGPSGLASVRMFARAPGAGGYRREAVDASPGATGEFRYTAITPDGTYSFYTRALDRAGNNEPAPAVPDSVTVLDRRLPSSRASSPQTAPTSTFRVSYDASDAGPAGLGEVQLWARGPGESAYAKAATDTSPAASGGFDYRARRGDGAYSFFAVAVDKAGNAESAPTVADSTTLFTSVPPAVTIDGVSDALLAAADASTDVAWRSDQRGAYTVRVGGEGCSTGAVAASGEYSSGAATTTIATELLGEGATTIAVCVTNEDGRTGSATALVHKDSAAPVSRATSPAVSSSAAFTVGYEAEDEGTGLAKVELWARTPGELAFSMVASNDAPAASGSFRYLALAGDGDYAFATVAVDRAGNRQPDPAAGQTTTLLDTAAPSSSASSPEYSRSRTVFVEYGAEDLGSGLRAVELWSRGPGDDGYARVAMDAAPGSAGGLTYTAPADGRYRFYTVAIDRAGNAESAPADADATTVVDTRAPDAANDFPAAGASFTAAAWDAGCGTAGGDVCGTAADETSGVAAVEVSIQRAADGAYWDGSSFSSSTEIVLDASGTTSWSYAFASASFPADGRYTLRARAVDRAGNAGDPVASELTVDVPPKVRSGGPYSGPEGSAIQLAGSLSSDATSAAWSYEPIGGVDAGAQCALGSSGSASTTFTCTDDGSYRLTLTASDGTNPPATSTTTVTVSNAAAAVAVKSPLNGARLSRFIPVTLTASFQDAGRNDAHHGGAPAGCKVDWGDGAVTTGTVTETAGSGSGTCSASHAYGSSGAYAVVVTVTDDDGGSGAGSVSITLL